MVHDTAHGFVKAPEPDGPEVDVPEAVIDLFEADLELGEAPGCLRTQGTCRQPAPIDEAVCP